jgi:hypothetical protein
MGIDCRVYELMDKQTPEAIKAPGSSNPVPADIGAPIVGSPDILGDQVKLLRTASLKA